MPIRKVLIVDDSAADLLHLKQVVETAGYAAITASSGKEALDIARAQKPDVILLDIVMDGMDGYKACRELANEEQTKSIPVIFVTSKNQKADRVWAQMQGAKAFISKPASQDAVLQELQAL
jgi:twitching motility two-component system response regulator PilH